MNATVDPVTAPCRACDGNRFVVEVRTVCCENLGADGKCRIDCLAYVEETFSCERCDGTGREPKE